MKAVLAIYNLNNSTNLWTSLQINFMIRAQTFNKYQTIKIHLNNKLKKKLKWLSKNSKLKKIKLFRKNKGLNINILIQELKYKIIIVVN